MVDVYSESIPSPLSGTEGAAAHISDGFANVYLAFPFGGTYVRARRVGGRIWRVSFTLLQHEAVRTVPAPSLQRSEQDPEAADRQEVSAGSEKPK